MIAHISIGVRDLARAKRFYDAALQPLGYRCQWQAQGLLGYGGGLDTIGLWIAPVEHPVTADPQSGLHICFAAPSNTDVDAFHAAALKNGGSDNGAPGLRPAYGPSYYAGFIVDPDGYRIEAYCAA